VVAVVEERVLLLPVVQVEPLLLEEQVVLVTQGILLEPQEHNQVVAVAVLRLEPLELVEPDWHRS